MLHHDPAVAKATVFQALRRIARCPSGETLEALAAICAPGAGWLGCHPINQLHGIEAIDARLWRPLKAAFPDLERRDDIFMGGSFQGGDWIAATGHYYGTFAAPWLGIPPHRGWAYLRYGEFYRLEGGRIVDCRVILDVMDLMRQAGVFPWRRGWGEETLAPGPATHDGVRLGRPDPAASARSLKLVEDMIFALLQDIDREKLGMERYWTPDMMWYGPGMIGTTRGLDGFFRYHEDPWAHAMPDWKGGNHTARIADDAYVASTGWPSIRATHTGVLLDLPPTGRPIEVRVMDWWRREGELLAENWIFIDFPHLFLQLDVDLFARMAELRDRAPRP